MDSAGANRGRESSPVKDIILNATEVAGRMGTVYSIGSFGRHVSFRAQQNRALNLVWALHEAGRIRPDRKAAVIGAGVTGLTAAAALVSHGCIVDVFERGIGAMPRQSETEHRLVHPTINAWPDSPLSITTELPFMEWHVGQCNVISRKLGEQFRSLCTPSGGILSNMPAERINAIASNVVEVTSGLATRPYGLVIVATGFGEETQVSGFPEFEYWEDDHLQRDRTTLNSVQFIVSGCGDGGMIDALRIVNLDFEKGMLAFEAAAELLDSEVARIVRQGEETAAGLTKDFKKAAALDQAYLKAAEYLATHPDHAELAQRLTESLERFPGIVYLTDTRWDPPFSMNAAPIHKLLVEFARQKGKIAYANGPVTQTSDGYDLDGMTFRPFPHTRVIVRHGANARHMLLELLKKSEVDEIERKQRDADFLSAKLWEDNFPAVGGAPVRDPGSKAFRIHRLPLARDAVQGIARNARIACAGGGYVAHYPKGIPAMAPESLFGVPTVSKGASRAPLI